MRCALVLLVLVFGLAVMGAAAEGPEQAATPGPEQRVEPVETGDEQHVERLDSATEQRVEHLDSADVQRLSTENKGPVRRGLETAGKVVIVTVALGVSLGFTLASLLFF